LLADAVDVVAGRDRPILAYVLADLDKRGFLDRDSADIARDLGVDRARVAAVLDRIQSVAPPGLASRGIRDCLARQLDAIERTGDVPPVVRPLLDHLEHLAEGRFGVIAAAIGTSIEDTKAGWAFIRDKLRPAAGLEEAGSAPPPPPPDLVVAEAADHSLAAHLIDDPRARLAVDGPFLRLARGTQPGPITAHVTDAERRDAQVWVARARQFLRQLERRRSTLEIVATAAANYQAHFFSHGAAQHRPLTRAELAEQLGLHESTVSRAVKGKVVRAPDGRMLPLAALFGSSVAAIEALRELLARPDRPAHDSALAAELHDRGFSVARRTVAKYRRLLVAPLAPATEPGFARR
jgi:RNA polymerase sigma-54 factor